MADVVTLEVDGTNFVGWESASIGRSLKSAAASFVLNVSERRTNASQKWVIVPGAKCQLFVNGTLVLTGRVDARDIEISAESHTVSIKGRSLTADFVDCSAVVEPGKFENQGLIDIANALTEGFESNVETSDGVGNPVIATFEVNQGESVFEAIERLCRLQGFLVSDTPGGNLKIFTPSRERDTQQITRYKKASAKLDYSKRFSEYIAKGQQSGAGYVDSTQAAQVTARITDDQVRVFNPETGAQQIRYRPKMVRTKGNTTPAEAQTNIEWQQRRDAGNSTSISLTLNGFTKDNGELWEPNKVIYFADEVLNVAQELLIVSVGFTQTNDEGTVTQLELAPESAYSLQPATRLANQNDTGDFWSNRP